MPIQNVLIVDDSKTEQLFLTSVLQKSGRTVAVADSAEAALQMLATHQPDLILMDVIMPGKNGFQLTRQLGRDPQYQHIPIIICSSKSQETDRLWGMRQGARAYVTKPINPATLLARIEALE